MWKNTADTPATALALRMTDRSAQRVTPGSLAGRLKATLRAS